MHGHKQDFANKTKLINWQDLYLILRVELRLICFACGCHFLGIFYLLAILVTRGHGINVQIPLYAWEDSRMVLRLPRPV